MRTVNAIAAAQVKQGKPSTSDSPSPRPFDLAAKVVLIGDASVGKTTVLQRLRNIGSAQGDKAEGTAGSTALEACRNTNGHRRLEYVEKIMEDDHGNKVLLKVHDTLGQERYRSLTASYYRDTLACLLFFDTAKEDSFRNLVHWLEEVRMYCGLQDIVTIIVGTQTASRERTVQRESAEKLAHEYNVLCVDVDKDSEVNVNILFKTVAGLVMQKYGALSPGHPLRRLSSKSSVSLGQEPVTKKFTCCAC